MDTTFTTSSHECVATPTPRPRRRRRMATVGLGVLVGAASIVGLASGADAATGTTGTHYRSAATCKPISSPVVAGQSQIAVSAPTIYGANTTTGLDGQTVSFRQRLVRWNGSAWVNTGKQSAVWSGFATDSTAALDFTDGSRTVRRPSFNFAAGPGYYAVVTDYWWSSTNSTYGGSNVAGATHSPSSNVNYCGFSY